MSPPPAGRPRSRAPRQRARATETGACRPIDHHRDRPRRQLLLSPDGCSPVPAGSVTARPRVMPMLGAGSAAPDATPGLSRHNAGLDGVTGVNFSASWRGSGSARWRSDGPDEQWPSGSPRFARRPGDLARLFPDVLMGGRLFPREASANSASTRTIVPFRAPGLVVRGERPVCAGPDDRSSLTMERWSLGQSFVITVFAELAVGELGVCAGPRSRRQIRWISTRVRGCARFWAQRSRRSGGRQEASRGAAAWLSTFPLSSPARAACCRRRARQRRRE